MADESVQVKFGAQIEGAVAGIDEVGNKLKDLNLPLRELAESFGLLRKTLIEAFAVREISEFVETISELGEQAIRTSTMLGIGVEKVQELGFAAKIVGSSSEETATGLMRLERNMAEAQSGSGKAYEAFKNLGISLDDLKTKSPDEILGMIADKFAQTQDGAVKTAYAMDLMGRSGAQLIPILDQGSQGLEQLGAQARDTGSVLAGPQAEALEKTHQSIVTLKASVEGVGISLFEVFHPAIDAAIVGLTQLVQWVNEVVKGLRLMAMMVEDEIVLSIGKLIESFQEMGTEGQKYIDEIKIAFETLGQVIDDVVHLHFDQAVKDWEAGSARIVAAEKNAAAEIANLAKGYEDFKTRVFEATASLFNFAEAGEKAQKASLPPAPTNQKALGADNSGESQEMQIEKNDLTTEEQLAKIGLQQKKDILDQEVADHAISKQQELAAEMEFARENEQIEIDAVDKFASLYDQDTVQYAEAQNKKKIIAAQANEQIAKLTAQSASEQKKEYDTLFQSVERASQQAVNGILAGTQTWQAALQRIFSNILSSFVDDLVVKRVLKWLEGEAMMLTGTQAKNAAIMTSDAAASDAGLAGMAVKAVKAITTDAAEAFGGVFAFLAPELGPAAAGPAAAASAAVSAAAGGIPSFDVGSWEIPHDTLAMVHQGEMIIPAAQAAGIRDGGGFGASSLGGGDNYQVSISVSAIDTQTGAAFLKNNAGVIAQAITGQMRNANPAFRPRY